MKRLIMIMVSIFCTLISSGSMIVDVQFNSVNPNVIVQLNSVSPPNTNRVYAGEYLNNITFPVESSAGAYFGTITNPVQMFCIDLGAGIGTYSATLVNLSSAPVQSEYSNGESGYPMGEIRADWLGVLANSYWNIGYLTDSNRYAALQVAIWEIVFEGENANEIPSTWDVSNGDFMITDAADVITESNRILNNTTLLVGSNNISNMTQMNLGALSSGYYQDMLVRTTIEVPEPSGILLIVFSLGMFGLVCKKTRNRCG